MLVVILLALQGAAPAPAPARCPTVQTPKGRVLVCDADRKDLAARYRILTGLSKKPLTRPSPPTVLSGAEVIRLARQPFDKAAEIGRHEILGRHGRAMVVADYICSDVCPDYTVRIIHYDANPNTECARAGGVVRARVVPRGIAAVEEKFCVPKVLAWREVAR